MTLFIGALCTFIAVASSQLFISSLRSYGREKSNRDRVNKNGKQRDRETERQRERERERERESEKEYRFIDRVNVFLPAAR